MLRDNEGLVSCLVPALLRGNLRQVGGSLLAPSLASELYSNPMLPNLPVQVVLTVLKETQDGHGHLNKTAAIRTSSKI
jgi:hypothetical protein